MLSHGINFGACPFLKQPDLFCVNWNILSKTDFIIMISGCNEFDVFFLLIESTSPPSVPILLSFLFKRKINVSDMLCRSSS